MKEANPELQKDFKLWLNQLIRGYGIKASEANKIIDRLEAGDMTLLEATIKKNLETAKTEGEEKGIEKGIEKGKIETAKKMLDRNMDIRTISEITGLSEAKIKSLAKKPTKKAA